MGPRSYQSELSSKMGSGKHKYLVVNMSIGGGVSVGGGVSQHVDTVMRRAVAPIGISGCLTRWDDSVCNVTHDCLLYLTRGRQAISFGDLADGRAGGLSAASELLGIACLRPLLIGIKFIFLVYM
jgi:hypothetical protein